MGGGPPSSNSMQPIRQPVPIHQALCAMNYRMPNVIRKLSTTDVTQIRDAIRSSKATTTSFFPGFGLFRLDFETYYMLKDTVSSVQRQARQGGGSSQHSAPAKPKAKRAAIQPVDTNGDADRSVDATVAGPKTKQGGRN